MESMFTLRPLSEKIENYENYIFVQNSKNLEFIKLLILNIESLMIWQTIHQWCFDMNANSKSHLHILGADHQLFGKQSKKSGEILYWKKWQLSEYVTKVIKHLFRNTLFKSLIERLLIYHKKQELNDFGLKIRIFDISKIKFLKKIFLLETVHVTLKYHLLKYFKPPISW